MELVKFVEEKKTKQKIEEKKVGYVRALNRQDMQGLCRLPMPEMWRDEQQFC